MNINNLLAGILLFNYLLVASIELFVSNKRINLVLLSTFHLFFNIFFFLYLQEQASEAVAKKEKSGPPLRIRDFLHNKEKIVDILFQTVTGAALQELIPDYLKVR